MPVSSASRTLGVVVVHRPGRRIASLQAVRDLRPQVDALLLVLNGDVGDTAGLADDATQVISFATNRGTAAAWNAALSTARNSGYQHLYVLDQDSIPHADAVQAALTANRASPAAAVVQPGARDRLGFDPFPWNTVASGSLDEADAVVHVGGFGERLFVDEVDHELLARLLQAGYEVRQLRSATIEHSTGSPREVAFLGCRAVVSGHSAERRRLQGYSAGVLVRRYARTAPGTSVRLLLRHSLTAAKDVVAGQRSEAKALVLGLVDGSATSQPPLSAAERSCPYCCGTLVGRFGAVPDWRFGTGAPGDVYRCTSCGALAAGRAPSAEDMASWYSSYYTHAVKAAPSRPWLAIWPTPRRRREQKALRRYLCEAEGVGRFLEIGTGAGERLLEFADAGWQVVGQDLDPKAGQLARERGIDVHMCPVDELLGLGRKFDLIGLNHVLEHVADPAEMLGACAALLAPGGRICVISPNADSLGRILFGRWWFGLEQPRHLAIPTLVSLRQMTSRIGLRTICLKSMAANGAVILGGSLDRPISDRLPAGAMRQGGRFLTAFLGQSLGRAAITIDRRRGEEVVWVGENGLA